MKSNADIFAFSEQLTARMKEKLDEIKPDQDELLKIGEVISFIRGLIEELKEQLTECKFKNELEEIRFFKEVKPVILSQLIYYKKIFAVRLFDSFRDAKSRHANYYQSLQRMENFVRKNREFYEYCMTNQSLLDRHYFIRNGQYAQSVDLDTKFTTGYDTMVAKILAHEMLKKYLLAALLSTESETDRPSLVWTGSKTDLIELIYSLHSVEVLNGGSADIKLIATCFETMFNVRLGNVYKIYQEIQFRKSGQTNFLDQMKVRLTKRITDSI